MQKYKTEWDLGHIYKGDYKAGVKKDLATVKKSYLNFAKKYRKDKRHLKNAKALAEALSEYEKLSVSGASERPSFYYAYRQELNAQDSEAEAEAAKLSSFYAALSNELEFFILEIGKIPKPLQKKLLKSKELASFRYFLTKIFENARHHLSEAEEKIINLKSLPARSLWVSGSAKLLNKQTVPFEGKEITIAEAVSKLHSLKKEPRHALYKSIAEKMYTISDFAESEMNAIVTDKKIMDELRGFKTPYEATVKGYENDLKTVKDLVAVVTENFKISHRFYKLKAEMLGEQKLLSPDKGADLGEVSLKIPFEQAVGKTVSAFSAADPVFGDFVIDMFDRGLVDVFPKKGKHGGAFCSPALTLPTYILLNQTDDFRSLTTLAHEMGHALHTKYAKSQRPLYEGYTIATAEVASTFFENLVFDQEVANLGAQEKMILLHDKISDQIDTVFRQVACFNFENELHETVRKEGFVQKEKLAELMNKHMGKYLGPVFNLQEIDGYIFVRWSHIRSFFYVYSYAFGLLISDALYNLYKEDKKNIKKVVEFLSAGGSDTPENIFKKIGINPNKKFFEAGLKRIEANIDELEKLWKSSKNKK